MAGRPAMAPGTHGSISTTRLESGKVRALARYCRWDGHLRRVTATGPTEPAARRLLAKRILALLEMERALDGVDATSPFGEVAEAWLVELRTEGTAEAVQTNLEHRLRHFVLPTFQQIPINEVTGDSLECFLARLATVSSDRVRFTSAILNMVMDFAVRNGVLSANPMSVASWNP